MASHVIETRRSRIAELSPRSDRINSKYLDSFVFGTVSPRRQELFTIQQEPFNTQHPHRPAYSSLAYEVYQHLPPRSTWWHGILPARRISAFVCATLVFIILVALILAIMIPLMLRQQETSRNELKMVSPQTANNVPTSTSAAGKSITKPSIVTVTSAVVPCYDFHNPQFNTR